MSNKYLRNTPKSDDIDVSQIRTALKTIESKESIKASPSPVLKEETNAKVPELNDITVLKNNKGPKFNYAVEKVEDGKMTTILLYSSTKDKLSEMAKKLGVSYTEIFKALCDEGN